MNRMPCFHSILGMNRWYRGSWLKSLPLFLLILDYRQLLDLQSESLEDETAVPQW